MKGDISKWKNAEQLSRLILDRATRIEQRIAGIVKEESSDEKTPEDEEFR